MASLPNVSSGLREVPETETATTCKLCFTGPSADDRLGPLLEYVVDSATEIYCAHYFCLLFSSGLDQNGEEDEQVKGFLTQDILKEWRRGQRLKVSVSDSLSILFRVVSCTRDAFSVRLLLEPVRDRGVRHRQGLPQDLPLAVRHRKRGAAAVLRQLCCVLRR